MVCRVNHNTDNAQRRFIHVIVNERLQVEDKEDSIEQVDSSMSDAFIVLTLAEG